MRSGSTQESQSATKIGSAKWQNELVHDKIAPRILASELANIQYLKRINGTKIMVVKIASMRIPP